MGIWGCGVMGVWSSGVMGVCGSVGMGVWRSGCVVVWGYGGMRNDGLGLCFLVVFFDFAAVRGER